MATPDQKFWKYQENQEGTRFPHYDLQRNYRARLKQFLAPINPFELEQIPSHKRMAVTQFRNHRFSVPDPLPNPTRFTRFLPAHYDALHDDKFVAADNFQEGKNPSTLNSMLTVTSPILPPVCERYLFFYKRCKMINSAEQCGQEEREFLEVCPNFGLDMLRQGKLFEQKVRIIQREEYKTAMEVPEYNKGRTVADVDGRKRWVDGTAARLRPDSLWADGRYAGVTEDDIQEARRKVQARQAKEGYKQSDKLRYPKPIDPVYEVFSVEKPLYEGK